jgi:hypothetical protein
MNMGVSEGGIEEGEMRSSFMILLKILERATNILNLRGLVQK